MRRLETMDFWPELVELKDELSLRELGERFGVTPGAISAALKRTGVTRTPAPPGPRSARRRRDEDELPPEPEEAATAKRRIVRPDSGAPPADDAPRARPGSKDEQIRDHFHLLGQVPDAEVARAAGVSVRTIASYRARHDIAGYTGPRRKPSQKRQRRSKIDPFADLLGQVPDRVVADRAGVSLNAVRNYRVKRGIPAAGRRGRAEVAAAPPTAVSEVSSGLRAWQVTFAAGAVRVVTAEDLLGAASIADSAGLGEVCAVKLVGEIL